MPSLYIRIASAVISLAFAGPLSSLSEQVEQNSNIDDTCLLAYPPLSARQVQHATQSSKVRSRQKAAPEVNTVARGLLPGFNTSDPGFGTVRFANVAGGFAYLQGGLGGLPSNKFQTVFSAYVDSCGVFVPHLHANAAEYFLVLKGHLFVEQSDVATKELQVSEAGPGDIIIFPQGAIHTWFNREKEQLVVLGGFLIQSGVEAPDIALLGQGDGMGFTAQVEDEPALLKTFVAPSKGSVGISESAVPIFTAFNEDVCDSLRQEDLQSKIVPNSYQKNPPEGRLYSPAELSSGKFEMSGSAVDVAGPGGGRKVVAGQVSLAETVGTPTSEYDGGLAPGIQGRVASWPGLTNFAGGRSFAKFVLGYCGTLAPHVTSNAAEWHTVISGAARISYFERNLGSEETPLTTINVTVGDTFIIPQGSIHFWVNYSPKQQFVTFGGFTASAPEGSLDGDFFTQLNAFSPSYAQAILGAPPQAPEMFPLLETRSPSDCGGTIPCTACDAS